MASQVGRLRCLRGIDTLTAVGLCAEIGDFERFARAEQLMSYIGLVPSESTTGQQPQARVDHQDRIRARPPAAGRSRAGTTAPRRRSAKRSLERQEDQPPRSDRDRVDGADATASHLGQPRGPRKAPHDHRGRGRPRARRVRAGRSPRSSNRRPPSHIPPVGWVGGGPARAGNPRLTSEQPAPTGRPRSILDSGSPRRTMVLRHTQTRAYQADRASRTATRTATHPANPHTTRHTQRQMREIPTPPLTNDSPYQ